MSKIINGDNVNLCHLDPFNLTEYLKVYKHSSIFAKFYESNNDLWYIQENGIKNIKDDEERYLIIEKKSGQFCGIVECIFTKGIIPEMNIMVVPEYRKNGYGFEASKIICNKVLSSKNHDRIMWNTFASNIATCRIAEKLGGIKIEADNFVAAAITEAFQDDGTKNQDMIDNIIDTVSYEIKLCKEG